MPPHIPHCSLQQYIDFALQLSGSAFTVGMADEEHCNFAVSAPKHFHVPTVMSGFVHIRPVTSKPAHAMPAKPGPVHVMSASSQDGRHTWVPG